MRFSYAESMTDPSFYAPLARAAEEAGYHSMVIPDSICYPLHATSTYPYNPDGSREFLEDKPFLEPFSLIPALGAVTSRIRFTTFVVKVPIRNPVLLAKQATSTAVLTGNRLGLGVGTSPWREDYDVLGVDWASRGRRLDESIAILRGLAGRRLLRVPRPDLRPAAGEDRAGADRADPGAHRRSLGRRAAPGRPAGRRLDARRGRPGRPAPPARPPGRAPAGGGGLDGRRTGTAPGARGFEVHVISADAYTVDGVRRLEEQGVTDVIIGFRWPYATGPDTQPLGEKLDNLRRYADDVIAKM